MADSEILNDETIQESTDGTFDGNLEQLVANDKDNTLEIKEDITQDEVSAESPTLKADLNWTDPIVWHDPSFHKGVIVKFIDTDRSETTPNDMEQSSDKIDAVYFPLIKINQHIVANTDIIYMKLFSGDVLPELQLTVIDREDKITSINSAGANNEIVIVISAPINGVYKKIKLSFYIDNIITDFTGNNNRTYTYYCSLKLPIMKSKYPTSMNYPDEFQWPGCVRCKQPQQKIPNSWEFLHYIAQISGLGFATTKKCKEIPDRNWRNFNIYKTIEECLIKEREFAGTTEDEAIFDWWVDFYGYLVMINVPWVLNEDITIEHLGIYAISEIQGTNTENKTNRPKASLVNRTLTNSKDTTTFGNSHNLMIRKYEVLTDNSLYEKGTCSTYNIFMPKGAGGQNGLDRFDVQIEENSVAGWKTDMYLSEQTYNRNVDMSGTFKQKKKNIFRRYFENKRAKMLCVELEKNNLGLQRGTLLNIIIMETNPQNKSAMMANLQNLSSRTITESDELQVESSAPLRGEVANTSPTKEDHIKEKTIEIVNQGLSGLYYIDKITFEYNVEIGQRISQKLYLIKKGVWGNYVSPEGHYKVDHIELDSNPLITN